MTHNQSLYQKALLAWRQELVAQHDSTLKDKRMKMRDALRQKLEEMFGSDYPIELEDEHTQEEIILGAVIENLNFLALRRAAGDIHIVLMIPCPHCGYQMPSDSLTCLADLGRELLQFEMKGTLGKHECPGAPA
jgi:hypothetical protein